jgi:CheY-like chemotaxis protein
MLQKGQRSILYIDDDDDDRMMVKDAINLIDDKLILIESANAQEGLGYLQKAFVEKKLPCLVLLDLNMPGMNGRDMLMVIKDDEDLSKVPVVVFTTSSSELDKTFCKKYNVEMITKPFSFQSLKAVMQSILCKC